ncbi:MAG: hypothetical protein GY951_09850 [Psychromonas sp.]|nr:hypothetical protein [Alteromonadales bacterium]MCP5078343.1 hypothetical protein [Psychromonas sp.]
MKQLQSNYLKTLFSGLLFTSLLLLPLTVSSEQNSNKPTAGIPPQSAQDACNNLSEGAVCSFAGPRGDESGLCEYTPSEDKTFACNPNGGGQKKPPSPSKNN